MPSRKVSKGASIFFRKTLERFFIFDSYQGKQLVIQKKNYLTQDVIKKITEEFSDRLLHPIVRRPPELEKYTKKKAKERDICKHHHHTGF